MTSELKTQILPKAGKYLNFQLASEKYSCSVTEVSEIIRLCPITKVPRMPDYFLGMINLRGKIIPVIDLRLKLGLPEAVNLERTCIIVVYNGDAGGANQLVGLQVDVVDEVVAINADAIEAPPNFCDSISEKYIQAMAKVKDSVITILSIEDILANTDRYEADKQVLGVMDSKLHVLQDPQQAQSNHSLAAQS
jgi:purine-binding chemotaxis protein CheW